MANVQALKDELTNDPLTRGYSGMTDAQAADDLNTFYRERNRDSMTGDEIFQATDATEWGALTDAEKSQWLSFCGRSDVDPFGTANVAFVQSIFGGGSTTISTLSALRKQSITRAAELGLGRVKHGHVIEARN